VDTVEDPNITIATLTVRNTGTMAATIDQAYIMDGTTVSQTGEVGATNTITVSNTADIEVKFTGHFTGNAPYQIRLVTSTGYVVEGVYYTPATIPDVV